MRLPVRVCNWGSPAAIAKQASPSASISAVVTPKHNGTKVSRKRLAIINELDILDLGSRWIEVIELLDFLKAQRYFVAMKRISTTSWVAQKFSIQFSQLTHCQSSTLVSSSSHFVGVYAYWISQKPKVTYYYQKSIVRVLLYVRVCDS
jgi:hypothetical protein